MFKWFKRKKEKKEQPLKETVQSSESSQLEIPSSQETQESKPKKTGLIQRLKQRLSKTRNALTSRLDGLFAGKTKIDDEVLEELEEILIMADLGVAATQHLIKVISKNVSQKEINNTEQLKAVLKKEIINMLNIPPTNCEPENQRPFISMVVGVNGVGKTTTIAKLANYYKSQGKRVLLVAADTFRAAAIEQLEEWANRVGVSIFKKHSGADPAAVAFDGVQMAKKEDYDVVLIDTAGRLHTKVNLMEELKKIKRAIAKIIPEAPHQILLVLDATTGQNACSQAKMFHEALKISGIVMTKLDGTAKGGILVNIAHQYQLPICFIGIGEQMEDLRPFNHQEFAEALF